MEKINKRKTVVIGISLLPQHIEYIDHLMDEKAYMNRSEVFRRAIELLHEKGFPDYIYKKSATDIAKREKKRAEDEMSALTPIQFAEATIGNGIHVVSANGDEYYLTHTFGNTIWSFALSEIREQVIRDKDIIKHHKTRVLEYPVDKFIYKATIESLNKNKGIDIVDVINNDDLKSKIKTWKA